MTRLAIVDGDDALREALAALLSGRGMRVVAAAGNVVAGLDLVGRSEPDVALVDVRLPDGSGLDLTRELLARRPELGVILYTVDVDAVLLYSGLASGVRGYVLKVAPMAELVGAIERIAGGGSYVDPRVDRILLSPSAMSQVRQLSPREREVMRSMAEGRRATRSPADPCGTGWRRRWRRFRR